MLDESDDSALVVEAENEVLDEAIKEMIANWVQMKFNGCGLRDLFKLVEIR